jgi:hypothetical protein
MKMTMQGGGDGMFVLPRRCSAQFRREAVLPVMVVHSGRLPRGAWGPPLRGDLMHAPTCWPRVPKVAAQELVSPGDGRPTFVLVAHGPKCPMRWRQ